MAKKKIEFFDLPSDIFPAALEFLSDADSGRREGEFIWKNEKWEYTSYKLGNVIRIDTWRKK